MRIIARKALREFWEQHSGAREPLQAWYREVEREDWDTPAGVRLRFPRASIIGRNRVVSFNIKGNDEPDAAPVRLIVRRVKPTPGSQLALFASYSYHGFITDRDGETLELEADHRRHAEVSGWWRI